ncbi:MAG TPA: AMP-binding protein [Anaeromyxobacteraceae bacterium]|nr:AMP-binding protein [Anaeromyxobacteraceae bacterium]
MTNRLPVSRFAHRTLPALLEAIARDQGERVFIHWVDPRAPAAPPDRITFAGFREGVSRGADFLRRAGVGAGDRVLLVAENSPAWQYLSLGAQLLRAEPAAVFASLAPEQLQAIALRVAARAIYAATRAQWEKLLPVAGDLARAGLRAVVCGEPIDAAGLPAGVAAVALEDAVGEGAEALPDGDLGRLASAVGPEDPFLLLFTSGTTGRPKGVRLPQRSIVAAIEGGAGACGTTAADLGVHFLPFAHVAGHDQFFLALAQGHGLVMVARKEDIERALALGPSYVFSVPLVYDRIRLAAQAKLDALPRPLARLATAAVAAAARVRVDGSRALRDGLLARLADVLVGRALRRRLGGRIRALFSGGAPAAPALFRFFEGLGIPFVELYGMTETAGLISSNLLAGRRRPGEVGLVSPDHELRLAADGELLLRGPLLFSGYLEAEDGEGAFSDDGFYRTGDLARLDADGTLRIDGRKKALMVLSTGKKVAPEPVEQALASARPFEGAVLLGDGRPFVAAAVFVPQAELARLAAEGRDAAEALLERARAALASFAEFERPKRLVVIPGAPIEHPALVTPTLKIRRDAVARYLGTSIESLWKPA